jgi:hypothetical protein
MSGGAWDYAYSKLNDVAYRLQNATMHTKCDEDEPDDEAYSFKLDEDLIAQRIKLGNLLEQIANVVYEIEWHQSGDTGPDDERNAFNEFEHWKDLQREINEL